MVSKLQTVRDNTQQDSTRGFSRYWNNVPYVKFTSVTKYKHLSSQRGRSLKSYVHASLVTQWVKTQVSISNNIIYFLNSIFFAQSTEHCRNVVILTVCNREVSWHSSNPPRKHLESILNYTMILFPRYYFQFTIHFCPIRSRNSSVGIATG
jgi:hypothetical protein